MSNFDRSSRIYFTSRGPAACMDVGVPEPWFRVSEQALTNSCDLLRFKSVAGI